MSKQSNNIRQIPGVEPSLDHASALVQEYTTKLRAISRQIRDVRDKYLAQRQKRLNQHLPKPQIPGDPSQQEQQIWFELVGGFRSRHDEYTSRLRALIPQATKLAKHVSQLITHGTEQTIVKIDLGLRAAELESAIETARTLTNSNVVFLPS